MASKLLAALAGVLGVSAIAALAAAIWTSGDLSTRFGGTGALCIVVSVALAFASAWSNL